MRKSRYEIVQRRRDGNAFVIGQFASEDEARRRASRFVAVRAEVWRKATRARSAELVAEYGGMDSVNDAPPVGYAVRLGGAA